MSIRSDGSTIRLDSSNYGAPRPFIRFPLECEPSFPVLGKVGIKRFLGWFAVAVKSEIHYQTPDQLSEDAGANLELARIAASAHPKSAVRRIRSSADHASPLFTANRVLVTAFRRVYFEVWITA
jgi:hypothetical protein